MTTEQLRRVLHACPFEPFDIHLADGRHLTVKHPDFLALFPSGRTFVVTFDDESFEVVDLLLVTSLKIKRNGAARKADRS